MKHKRGRRELAPDDRRSRVVGIALTAVEHAKLKAAAERRQRSLAEWARMTLLEAAVPETATA